MTELLSTEHMFIADPSVFTVEKLLRKRKRHGSFEYLVKWRDYNFRFNTWEPESNILDQRLLDEFEERCKNGGDLFLKDDVYDTEMSDTENVERIANRRSAPVVRTATKTARKKRTTRSSTFKLRGRREKRAPIGKYEELENEVEEKLSEEEDLVDDMEDENKEGKEDADFDEGEDKVEDVSCVSDNEASASASPVRSLRNKKISKPISFGPAKKRTPSSKFSSLMKRSRKQAKTYGMQFSRKDCCAAVNGGVSPQASSAKLSSEDGDDQVQSDETAGPIKISKTKEPNKQKRKRAAEEADRVKLLKERQKAGSEEGEEDVSMKRKRPSRSCTVPSGFWDPVVKTGDSGIDSHSDNEDQSGSFKEEEVIRAQRRMKNFEPAPSNHETCYTETPAESSNGCINDLGESVFPKKKFCLRPPTLDLSKRPLSDFVFKIDDLWADKIHVSSVRAMGYSVKIFECKSAEALFTKKSSKLKRKESARGELGT
ncbi:hypothetical protein ACHWQZ_G009447 [Mnemiopsis leidyi]